MSFLGTQQKCKACEKTVYPVDQLSADGTSYHKACFRCSHCKGTLKVFASFLCCIVDFVAYYCLFFALQLGFLCLFAEISLDPCFSLTLPSTLKNLFDLSCRIYKVYRYIIYMFLSEKEKGCIVEPESKNFKNVEYYFFI